MKTNYHTHSTWCDGRDAPEAIVLSAVAHGFDALGFSSHALLPGGDEGTLSPETAPLYVEEIRALAAQYADRLRILCGIEADYIPGEAAPRKADYAHLGLDYMFGSIHYVVEDGRRLPVDHTPQLLLDGIASGFGGDAEAYVRAYFAQTRDMVTGFDFDVVGHPDLVRKFNGKLHLFDETAAWYREELRLTADAIAASGKIVEVNTGAISRGWMDDAYPSAEFRTLLRERGVRFILSSDAHAADTLDCAFDRFGNAEAYLPSPCA